jgi:hypothetical protein
VSESAAPPSQPGRSRPVFWLLAFALVAGGIELGCRLIERVENAAARRKNPYVEAVNPVPAFEVVEQDGQKVVRRTGFHPLMVQPKPFPLARPEGGLRVFVLGGSAAAGWPFQLVDTNLSALLQRKLEALQPGRPIEVINMAAGTYGSHRVKLILEEVLQYQPDLLVLYNGNNELLEGLVYRPRTPPAPWDRSAAARLAGRWRRPPGGRCRASTSRTTTSMTSRPTTWPSPSGGPPATGRTRASSRRCWSTTASTWRAWWPARPRPRSRSCW